MRRNLLAVGLLLGLAATALAGVQNTQAPPRNALQTLHLAIQALQDESYAEAETLARRAAEHAQSPEPYAWLITAVACQRTQQFDRAQIALENFLAAMDDPELRTHALERMRQLAAPSLAPEIALVEQLAPAQLQALATVEAQPSVYQSEHFTVHGHNASLLQLVAQQAELTLARLQRDLLPAETAIAVAADIYLWPDAEARDEQAPPCPAGADGAIHPLAGETATHRIDLLQRNPEGELAADMLTDVLPHELCHLLVETFLAIGQPGSAEPASMPLAMREGLATLAETYPDARYVRLAGTAAAADAHIPLEELLAIDTYDDVDHLSLFYAESYSFVQFLHARLTRGQFSELMEHLRKGHDVHDALERTLAARHEEAFAQKLEAAWRDHAILQAQIIDAFAQRPASTPPAPHNTRPPQAR